MFLCDPNYYCNFILWIENHSVSVLKILFMSCILSRINKIYRFCWYTGMIDRINWKILSLEQDRYCDDCTEKVCIEKREPVKQNVWGKKRVSSYLFPLFKGNNRLLHQARMVMKQIAYYYATTTLGFIVQCTKFLPIETEISKWPFWPF